MQAYISILTVEHWCRKFTGQTCSYRRKDTSVDNTEFYVNYRQLNQKIERRRPKVPTLEKFNRGRGALNPSGLCFTRVGSNRRPRQTREICGNQWPRSVLGGKDAAWHSARGPQEISVFVLVPDGSTGRIRTGHVCTAGSSIGRPISAGGRVISPRPLPPGLIHPGPAWTEARVLPN